MFIATATFTAVQALITALLEALGTRPAAALLTTPSIELFTAWSGRLNPQSTYSQATVATFSGYAITAITLSGPVEFADSIWGMIGTVNFIATTGSPFVPDTILGYMLTNGTGTLYGGEFFQNPVPIAAPTDFLTLNFAFPLNAFMQV
jgi:hypothetical protein